MTKNLVNDRQIRWSLQLSNYKFKIHYKPGTRMQKADALSRRMEHNDNEIHGKQTLQLLPDHVIESVGSFSAISTATVVKSKDTLINAISKHTYLSSLWNDLVFNNVSREHFTIRNGLIYYEERIFVPDVEEVKLLLCQYFHDNPYTGHLGVYNTLELISREFYFPGMKQFITRYVLSCDQCARSKARRHLPYGLLHPLPVPTRPWSSISMDFVGPLPASNGFNMILVVIDRLTKLCHFIACNDTLTAIDFVTLLEQNIFKLHGFPDTIVSDRGTLFTSKFWSSFAELLNIKLLWSTAYHQQTNGQSERLVQRLKEYLRIFINYQQDDWFNYLPYAEFAFNNSHHTSIGMSPFKATYGHDFNLVIVNPDTASAHESNGTFVSFAEGRINNINDIHKKLQDAIKKSQESQKDFADKSRKESPEFTIGSKVWLRTTNLVSSRKSKSLDYKYIGPFEIKARINEVTYKLSLPERMKIHDEFHVSLLEPCNENDIEGRIVPPPPPIEVVEDDEVTIEYEVQEILDKRVRKDRKGKKNQVEYFVHWKGYGISERSWEPLANLDNSQDLIKEFEEKFKNSQKPARRKSRRR